MYEDLSPTRLNDGGFLRLGASGLMSMDRIDPVGGENAPCQSDISTLLEHPIKSDQPSWASLEYKHAFCACATGVHN